MLLTIWKNKHVFDLSITMEKVYEKKIAIFGVIMIVMVALRYFRRVKREEW